MTLRCLIFGHRRSRSRATFDEKHQHWLSDCRRCHIMLVRDADGKWRPAPPPPQTLEPISREEPVEAPEQQPREVSSHSAADEARSLVAAHAA
jgi:hypothetical protein